MMSRAKMITISESAKAKITDLLSEENNSNLYLRTFIQGGGCAGFSYGFTFDEEKNEDDFEIVKDGVSVLVDSMSYQYLAGSTVDFYDDELESQFVINNPNAQTTCGCGSSFSI